MGDGILAVFGAPKPLENACRDAFEAGRTMLKYVSELNVQFHSDLHRGDDDQRRQHVRNGMRAPSDLQKMAALYWMLPKEKPWNSLPF